ncbi:hypothetical protein IMSAGC006_00174 [Muribaculaceae bacterium]|nr:hypothetical protein IMSAGC006_00174 [Muribaculaceae bacterium]
MKTILLSALTVLAGCGIAKASANLACTDKAWEINTVSGSSDGRYFAIDTKDATDLTDQEKLDIIIARLEDVKALYQRYSESVPFVADMISQYAGTVDQLEPQLLLGLFDHLDEIINESFVGTVETLVLNELNNNAGKTWNLYNIRRGEKSSRKDGYLGAVNSLGNLKWDCQKNNDRNTWWTFVPSTHENGKYHLKNLATGKYVGTPKLYYVTVVDSESEAGSIEFSLHDGYVTFRVENIHDKGDATVIYPEGFLSFDTHNDPMEVYLHDDGANWRVSLVEFAKGGSVEFEGAEGGVAPYIANIYFNLPEYAEISGDGTIELTDSDNVVIAKFTADAVDYDESVGKYCVRLDAPMEDVGVYTLTVPAGFFVVIGEDDVTSYVDAMTASVTVETAGIPDVTYPIGITPGAGEVDKIESITIACGDKSDMMIVNFNDDKAGDVTLSKGTETIMSVSKNKMAEDYDDSVKGEPTFTIAGLDLSVPGTYTLDVPARFFCSAKGYNEHTSVVWTITETGLDKIEMTDGSGNTVVYDLQGRCVDNAIRGGLFIVNGKKIMVK